MSANTTRFAMLFDDIATVAVTIDIDGVLMTILLNCMRSVLKTVFDRIAGALTRDSRTCHLLSFVAKQSHTLICSEKVR
jgi:hypothetical protein